MITCYLEYHIDPYKLDEFRNYIQMWLPLIEKHGGTHHGYFLPKESTSDIAIGLFTFDSLAAYEQYRINSREDDDCKKASAYAHETRCIVRVKRQFLEPVLPSSSTL